MRHAVSVSRRITAASQVKTSLTALKLRRGGDGFSSITICFRGASNLAEPQIDASSQDQTVRSCLDRVAARILNPDAILNAGRPGLNNAEVLTKYNTTHASNDDTGDPAQYKTPAHIVQMGSINDIDTNPRSRLVNFRDIETAMAGNSVPQHAFYTSFSVTSTWPTDDWIRNRVLSQLAMVAWPGQYGALAALTLNPTLFPTRSILDDNGTSHGGVGYSYRYTKGSSVIHLNSLGHVIQGDACFFPAVRAMNGILPCLLFPDLYSTASTANDAGGFVADQVVMGDLAGCTVVLENHRRYFNVAVQATGLGTSTIRITRNEGGAILEPYRDLRIRITRGAVSDVSWLRVGIGSLDGGVYEVDYNTDGKYNTGLLTGLHYGMWEPHTGVSNGKKWSCFVKFRPLTGSNGQDLWIIDGGTTGLNMRRNTSNQTLFFVRDGTNPSPSTVTLSDTKTVDDTKDCCIFVSIDIDAGVGFFRVETRGIAGGAVSADDHSGVNTAGATMGLSLLSQRFHNLNTSGIPMRHGALWEAADYIDFSQESNRALFRDVSTLALANNYDRVNNDRVTRAAGTGSGTTITPYCSINGNAADRWNNPNRGTGTTTTTDANDTGRMVTAFIGNIVLTV